MNDHPIDDINSNILQNRKIEMKQKNHDDDWKVLGIKAETSAN